MFVLLLIEICRSLFDDLHLNSDDGQRTVRCHSSDYSVRHRRRTQIYQQAPLSLNLHVNPATSGVDIKACLSGGKADYHAGLI